MKARSAPPTPETDLRESTSTALDFPNLLSNFLYSVEQRSANCFARQRLNIDARECNWPGKDGSGKKWKKDRDGQIFPWPGASDCSPNLIDLYVRTDQAMLMNVFTRMRSVVSGTEINDVAWGKRMTSFLRWMKYKKMPETRREARLAANTFLERGTTAMGIFWEKRTQLAYQELDLEEIKVASMNAEQRLAQRQAQPMDEVLANLPAMIMDPEAEAEVIKIATLMLPDVEKKVLPKIVKDLRETGHAKYPAKVVVKNQPVYVSLTPNEDFFIPPDATTEIQMAPQLDRVELLTESMLTATELDRGWDPLWIADMIKTQRGRITNGLAPLVNRTVSEQRNRQSIPLKGNRLFQVVHSYRRMTDENGVPGIYYTCWSPGITNRVAYHDLLNYQHGEYPFVMGEREVRSRMVDDSRGYGEVGSSWQQQIKVQMDSRIDRTSLATLPPSYHPDGMEPDKWGPGVKIGTTRPDAYGFMAVPKHDVGSEEIEEKIRRLSDEYFGRKVSEFNAVEAQNLTQDLVNNWMDFWEKIDTQMLQLCQQFMPDKFYFRVVGSSKGQGIHASLEDIQGKFDLTVSYNVQDLDPSLVESKIGLLEKAATFDSQGVMDRNETLQVIFELADPEIGERVLRPVEEATQQEMADMEDTFAKMFANIPQNVKPGQNYKLRLQMLEDIMKNNTAAQKRFGDDEQFKKIVETYSKQLYQQGVVQPQNALIGKRGG